MMRIFIVALLVAFSNSLELKSSTPTFTLSEERSIDGSPKIHVVFQNGEKDTIILSTPEKTREETEEELEEPEETRDSEPLYKYGECRYFGRLENEPDACVAVTGCPGSDDVEMTILSKNIQETPAYLWTNDGTVENIIMKGEATGVNYEETNRNASNGNPPEYEADSSPPEYEESAEDWSPDFDSRGNFELRKRGNPPAGMKLTLQIVYGHEFYKTVTGPFSNRKNYIRNTIHHAQAYYCHSSLGSKIELSIGHIGYSSKHFYTRKATGQSVDLYKLTPKLLKSGHDLIAYIGRDYDTNDWVGGVAETGSVCGPWKSHKWSLSEWEKSVASFGHLVAHEIGHNFGMYHDFTKKCNKQPCKADEKLGAIYYKKSCNCQGIESYRGSNGCPNTLPAKWSSCSKNYFFHHYKTVANWCLDSKTVSICDYKKLCDMSRFNDGICDDVNNIEACRFDGGDCCDRRNSNWDQRCNKKDTYGDCTCKEGGCKLDSPWCNDKNWHCGNKCTIKENGSLCRNYCKRFCGKCSSCSKDLGNPGWSVDYFCGFVKKHNLCNKTRSYCGKQTCGNICKKSCGKC